MQEYLPQVWSQVLYSANNFSNLAVHITTFLLNAIIYQGLYTNTFIISTWRDTLVNNMFGLASKERMHLKEKSAKAVYPVKISYFLTIVGTSPMPQKHCSQLPQYCQTDNSHETCEFDNNVTKNSTLYKYDIQICIGVNVCGKIRGRISKAIIRMAVKKCLCDMGVLNPTWQRKLWYRSTVL